MTTFNPGDRVEYIGKTTPSMVGRFGVVVAQTTPRNVDVRWEGPPLDRYIQHADDNIWGCFPQNLQLETQNYIPSQEGDREDDI